MAAPPTAWTQAWPNLPELSCIQLVFVAQDGSPAMDRGLNKRTYAGTKGAIVILGCPHLAGRARTGRRRRGPGIGRCFLGIADLEAVGTA